MQTHINKYQVLKTNNPILKIDYEFSIMAESIVLASQKLRQDCKFEVNKG